jgi:hypothetical protein
VTGFRVALQSLQIGTNFGGMLTSQVAIFFQALIDDLLQFGWQVRVQPHRRNGITFQNGVEDDPGTLAPERQCPSRHLVQNRPEGEQVGACVQFLGADLFRRHVGDGSHSRSRTGKMLLRVYSRGAHGNVFTFPDW